MPSPIVNTTIQSCVLNATSNIIAQVLTAYRSSVCSDRSRVGFAVTDILQASYTINWIPVLQFTLFNALNCPPNFLWQAPPPPLPSPLPTSPRQSNTPAPHRQSFLESTFPSHYFVPSDAAILAAAKNDEKELDREESTHTLLDSKLSIPNTIIKFLLDQTIGATINTLLFSLVFAGFRGEGYEEAVGIAREEFWPLMKAGWTVWPAVSLLNYAAVKSVEGRALVGSLAGMGWGVYLSLVQS